MTLDGYCDHTAIIPDEEIHKHYTQLLRNAGTVLYGRITYGLMESYWPALVKNPSGNKSMDEFAEAMDTIPKIVFSNTQNQVEWESARLAKGTVKQEVLELKQQAGKEILVASRSLIVHCLNLNLIDEFQLCIHPVIAGKGLPLLENVKHSFKFKLLKSKTFRGGAVLFYYQPIK